MGSAGVSAGSDDLIVLYQQCPHGGFTLCACRIRERQSLSHPLLICWQWLGLNLLFFFLAGSVAQGLYLDKAHVERTRRQTAMQGATEGTARRTVSI